MAGILALDIATSCGWAHWSAQEGLSYGTLLVQSGGRSRARRIRQFFHLMDPLVCRTAPIQVVIEKAHIGPDRYAVPFTLFGLQAVAMAVCQWSDKVRIAHVTPQEHKQHFTGYGSAKKDQTIWRCQQYGWPVANDDEADAISILHWSMAKYLKRELHEIAGPVEQPAAAAAD